MVMCFSVKRVRAFTKISQSWENYHQGNTVLDRIGTSRGVGFTQDKTQLQVGNWVCGEWCTSIKHIPCDVLANVKWETGTFALSAKSISSDLFLFGKMTVHSFTGSSFSFHMEMITFLLFFLSTVAMI